MYRRNRHLQDWIIPCKETQGAIESRELEEDHPKRGEKQMVPRGSSNWT